jgi:MFS transporter, DHA2 family, multidrug resistance protein
MANSKSAQLYLVVFAVIAPTVMSMLMSTSVNVAVPTMAGALGVTPDKISWVITSYMVAMTIMLPVTGFLTDRLGRRNLLLLATAGFVVSSWLCGLASGLDEMVLFRIVQGAFGATFVPLSRTIMVEAFPRNQMGRATAIWGMGVTAAPIFGPTLGGYLIDAFSWRWIFFINLPIALLSFVLAVRYVPKGLTRERRVDWAGLISLAIAVGALQLVLDRGQGEDWFESSLIVSSAVVAVAGFAVFLTLGLRSNGNSICDLTLFKDRNFTLGCLLMSATGVGLFGGNYLQPLFLDNVLAYPAMTSGLVLMSRGVGSLFSMGIAGRFTDRMSAKWVALPGAILSIWGAWMMTRYNAQVAFADLLLPLFLQGVGMGLMFVPLSTLAFTTIPVEKAAEASGLYSLVRSLGAAIGVSWTSTFLARSTYTHWGTLRGYMNPFNPAVLDYLQGMNLQPGDPLSMQLLGRTLGAQARLTAFVDSFWFITVSFVIMIPLILMLKERQKQPSPATLVQASD